MKTRYRRINRQSGQAIAEGTAFLVVILPLLFLITFLNVFVVVNGYYHLMLAQVADAGARQAVQYKYWMGAERPVVSGQNDPSTIQSNVQGLCTNLWKAIGLPGTVQAAVTLDTAGGTAANVAVTLNGVPTLNFLPLGVQIANSATASEPYANDTPIAVLGLSFNNASTNPIASNLGMYVPTYGTGTGTGAGSSGSAQGWSRGPSSYPTQGTVGYFHATPVVGESNPQGEAVQYADNITDMSVF